MRTRRRARGYGNPVMGAAWLVVLAAAAAEGTGSQTVAEPDRLLVAELARERFVQRYADPRFALFCRR